MYKHLKCFPAGHLHAPFATGHNIKYNAYATPPKNNTYIWK